MQALHSEVSVCNQGLVPASDKEQTWSHAHNSRGEGSGGTRTWQCFYITGPRLLREAPAGCLGACALQAVRGNVLERRCKQILLGAAGPSLTWVTQPLLAGPGCIPLQAADYRQGEEVEQEPLPRREGRLLSVSANMAYFEFAIKPTPR